MKIMNKIKDNIVNEHNVNNSETKSSLSGKNNNNIKGFGVNKKEINENTTPEELIDNPHNRKIYEYKNGYRIKYLFYLNILFIFGHSALLILEIVNPLIGIFHGSMLLIGVVAGYLGLFLIGKVSSKVAWKIYKVQNSERIVVEYLSYSWSTRPRIVNPRSLSEFEMSNLEGFHVTQNKDYSDEKLYLNFKQNIFANSQANDNFRLIFQDKLKI